MACCWGQSFTFKDIPFLAQQENLFQLNNLPGLLTDFIAATNYLTFSGTNVTYWSPAEGTDTNKAAWEDYLTTGFATNAWGAGKNAVFFYNGKMTVSVNWSYSNMTVAVVGNIWVNHGGDPRFWSFENHTNGLAYVWEDYAYCIVNPIELWGVRGFGTDTYLFDLYVLTEYVIVTRKQGPTVTCWLRPLGQTTSSNAFSVSPVGLFVDTVDIAGNQQPMNLNGQIARLAIWGRDLTDAEVGQAITYLDNLYKP